MASEPGAGSSTQKPVLSESKKLNSLTSSNVPVKILKQLDPSKTPSQNSCPPQALHRSVSQASSAISNLKRIGFPEGRYNSPTDSLISPISKGLLRRGKRAVGPKLHEFVRPKVLDNSYEIENHNDKSTLSENVHAAINNESQLALRDAKSSEVCVLYSGNGLSGIQAKRMSDIQFKENELSTSSSKSAKKKELQHILGICGEHYLRDDDETYIEEDEGSLLRQEVDGLNRFGYICNVQCVGGATYLQECRVLIAAFRHRLRGISTPTAMDMAQNITENRLGNKTH